MKLKKWLLLFCAAGLCFLLSGCFMKTVDELYTLPRHSDAYNNLQSVIDILLQNGAAYSAPISGTNRQSVQLADLDGDGEDEAIAFLRTGEQKPLKAYIFDCVDGSYEQIGVIEGSGTAFTSVEYAQLDGADGDEIILSRQISDSVLQTVSAYTIKDGNLVELMSANDTLYTTADLDGSGLKDIVVIRFDTEQQQGVAECYRWRGGQMEREPEISLSSGVGEIKRIVSGNLNTGIPAVFVAETYGDDEILTDILAFRGDKFQNVTQSDSGQSVQTVRSYYVYAMDIDSDGLIELPEIVDLPGVDSDEEQFSIIRWYNLDLNCRKTVKVTTYHNFSGGWYVTLPQEWEKTLSITRSEEVSGVRGYCFWQGSGIAKEKIFTIYAFTGENRQETATQNGRFILSEKGDVAYSAALGDGENAKALNEEALKQMFNYIHMDWNSGET